MQESRRRLSRSIRADVGGADDFPPAAELAADEIGIGDRSEGAGFDADPNLLGAGPLEIDLRTGEADSGKDDGPFGHLWPPDYRPNLVIINLLFQIFV